MHTITTRGGTAGGWIDVHYSKNRRLSIEELAILSSFPPQFQFIGKPREKVSRIGNCVPPFLIKAIAETLKEEGGNE